MLTLVDSGSSHNFVSAQFLRLVGIQPVPTAPQRVKLANGQILISEYWVPQMSWWCNGYTLQADMKVLELGAFNATLGYDWLQSRSPMLCHWSNKTMEFEEKGKLIKLQGALSPTQKVVQCMTANQLLKGFKGNEIWALAVLSKLDQEQEQEHSSELAGSIQELLSTYPCFLMLCQSIPGLQILSNS